jgi:uncharacterized membrane protein YgcG
MKNIRLLTFVLIIGTLVLSACGAAAATPTAAPQPAKSAKVDAMPVSFVGIVDSIAGDQWVISGTTVTVNASVVRDGPFDVGDQVKVEGFVNSDGSFTISRVESPTPQESATLPAVSVDNSNEAISNANTNDANVNDSSSVNSNDDNSNASNSNDSNINDDNGGNSNDDNSNSSNDNGDDNGGDRGNDNGDDDSGKGRGGDDDNGGNGRGGDDDSGGDDHGGGGGGSDN